MAGVLPSVRGGRSALAPWSRNVTYGTDIAVFENSFEQRYPDRGPLDTFVLSYSSIKAADRLALDQFIANQKGSADTTWTFPLPSAQILQNGGFSLGLKYWTPTYVPGFIAPFVTSTGYTRAGEPNAVFVNAAYTIPAHGVVSAQILSAPFGYGTGEQLTLDLWTSLFTNSGLAAGVTATLRPGIVVSGSSGVLGTINATSSITGATSWRTITESLPANPFSSSTVGQALISVSLTNTTSSAVALPFNCVAALVSGVRLFYNTRAPNLYHGCTFEDDQFTWTENQARPNQYDTQIKFRQTLLSGQSIAATLGDFPLVGPGNACRTGYPYISTDNYYVARVDLPSGPRSSYAYTGQPGFPSRALKSWTLTFSTLTDSWLSAIETHYLAAVGRWRAFGFTDPKDLKRYPHVRYDMDSLAITHLQKGMSSTTVKMVEVYYSGWTP